MQKIRVGVLYGGRSGEHDISLLSAANVIHYLDRSRFDIVPIGIDKQGTWLLGEQTVQQELTKIPALHLPSNTENMLFNPDAIGKSIQQVQSTEVFSKIKKPERIFDVIFPVIHGTFCEDGTVQGLLELADLPYVGCGVLSSAVGMDKDVSKRLIENAGISIAPFVVIKRGQWDKNPDQFLQKISATLRYPLFVKPANTGSSVGIEKIKTEAGLFSAINQAFCYDTKVIVEQGIDAIELEVAVLESLEYGADPIVSVVGEVTPNATHGFYSYAAKYLDEHGATLTIPAVLSDALQEKVRDAAKLIFAVLDCEGMARVDLFLEKNTNQIYFNEINTIPGFTEISMYPKLMAATGVEYADLLTHLIQLAVAKHERKMKLVHESVV